MASALFALLVSLAYNAFFEHIPAPSYAVGEAEEDPPVSDVVAHEVVEEMGDTG